jgi:hypothetical protein
VILALNHTSNADSFVTGPWITLALRHRRIHWLGKQELFDWPVFGWLAGRGGVHPVGGHGRHRGVPARDPILEAGRVADLPEGTRSPDGTLRRRRRAGVARAPDRRGHRPDRHQRRRPPVAQGPEAAVADPAPDGHRPPRAAVPGRGRRAAGRERRAAKAIATTAIMARIAALLEPRQRGHYAGAVRDGEAGARPAGP